MKTIAKPNALAPRRRRAGRARPANQLTDEEFRRQIEVDLAAELAAARNAAQQRYGHLLRPRTPAEIADHTARVRAMFARWEEDNRKNPVSRDESESYDRMLARMAAERAG